MAEPGTIQTEPDIGFFGMTPGKSCLRECPARLFHGTVEAICVKPLDEVSCPLRSVFFLRMISHPKCPQRSHIDVTDF